jgi:hypothetical protein
MTEEVEQTVARIEEVVEDFRTFLLAFDAFQAKAIPQSALPYTPDHIAKALRLWVEIRKVTGSLTEGEESGAKNAYVVLSTVLPDDEATLVNTFASLQRLLGGPKVANDALLAWPVFQSLPAIVARLDVARTQADQTFQAILTRLSVRT